MKPRGHKFFTGFNRQPDDRMALIFDGLKKQFLDDEISRKEFLNRYNDPATYQPQETGPNLSRRYD